MGYLVSLQNAGKLPEVESAMTHLGDPHLKALFLINLDWFGAAGSQLETFFNRAMAISKGHADKLSENAPLSLKSIVDLLDPQLAAKDRGDFEASEKIFNSIIGEEHLGNGLPTLRTPPEELLEFLKPAQQKRVLPPEEKPKRRGRKKKVAAESQTSVPVESSAAASTEEAPPKKKRGRKPKVEGSIVGKSQAKIDRILDRKETEATSVEPVVEPAGTAAVVVDGQGFAEVVSEESQQVVEVVQAETHQSEESVEATTPVLSVEPQASAEESAETPAAQVPDLFPGESIEPPKPKRRGRKKKVVTVPEAASTPSPEEQPPKTETATQPTPEPVFATAHGVVASGQASFADQLVMKLGQAISAFGEGMVEGHTAGTNPVGFGLKRLGEFLQGK